MLRYVHSAWRLFPGHTIHCVCSVTDSSSLGFKRCSHLLCSTWQCNWLLSFLWLYLWFQCPVNPLINPSSCLLQWIRMCSDQHFSNDSCFPSPKTFRCTMCKGEHGVGYRAKKTLQEFNLTIRSHVAWLQWFLTVLFLFEHPHSQNMGSNVVWIVHCNCRVCDLGILTACTVILRDTWYFTLLLMQRFRTVEHACYYYTHALLHELMRVCDWVVALNEWMERQHDQSGSPRLPDIVFVGIPACKIQLIRATVLLSFKSSGTQ